LSPESRSGRSQKLDERQLQFPRVDGRVPFACQVGTDDQAELVRHNTAAHRADCTRVEVRDKRDA
jgi:hypothetical protein